MYDDFKGVLVKMQKYFYLQTFLSQSTFVHLLTVN